MERGGNEQCCFCSILLWQWHSNAVHNSASYKSTTPSTNAFIKDVQKNVHWWHSIVGSSVHISPQTSLY